MTKKIKLRSLLMGGFFTLFFVLLIYQCYKVQVVNADWLVEKAEVLWSTDKKLAPKRGVITDRNGAVLAEDVPAYTVAVNPQLIDKNKQTQLVLNGLAEILQMNEPDKREKLYGFITKHREDGVLYKHVEVRSEGWKIDVPVAASIKEWAEREHVKGVYLIEEKKRYYPSNRLASHILGYTDKEGTAMMGLELSYNDILKGEPGWIRYEKDRMGMKLPDGQMSYTPAVDGQSLRLTIDMSIQQFVEQAMEKTLAQFKPKSMTVIAVDPNTMEVLALANAPNFDPNAYWQFDTYGDFYNHAVASNYEPGSTFKIVTLAGAVDAGIFDPEDKYKSGRISVKGATISDHNQGRGWGDITYLEGLKRSSNVAFVKLGFEGLGRERLRNYIEGFGFGKPTGIDLPGEKSGTIQMHYDSEVATASFGQGITVTPIQQVVAVAAAANGGKLMKPYIVKEIIDSQTEKPSMVFGPEVIGRAISERSSRKVNEYLEQVVADQTIGTGRRAYIDGYRVAGKTGTAQKVVDRKYSEDKFVVSFVGYAPVEDPKIAVVVIVDEPERIGTQGGGDIAAPVFKEIVSQSLRYMSVPSTRKLTVNDNDVLHTTMPDLAGLAVGPAVNELEKRKLPYEVLGNGERVTRQFPESGTKIGQYQRTYILTEPPIEMPFPDLTGKSLRDALESCSLFGANCRVEGEGFVIKQTMSQVDGVTVTLELSPHGGRPPESE